MDESQELHNFSIKFEYEEGSTFDKMSSAMLAFSEAVAVYSKTKKTELRIKSFEPGSLVCEMEVPEQTFTGLKVMAGDFHDIAQGQVSSLMPEAARAALKKVLGNIKSVQMNADQFSASIDSSTISSLEYFRQPIEKTDVIRAGILDKVDLKANTFRIMLPHGKRITCSPALPFMDDFSSALKNEPPRVKIYGAGNHSLADPLPNAIKVTQVEIIENRPTFLELVESLKSKVSPEHAQHIVHEVAEEAEDTFEANRMNL
ncbi:MAG: hypothetical protein JST51_13735 [Armatimonadetes bacterium]|nr:hypothetical protein [Armatimonadota bacterium]